MDNIRSRLDKVQPTYTRHLGWLLYNLALSMRAKLTVECGIGEGYVSAILTWAMNQLGGMHYAIEIDKNRIEKLKLIVKNIKCESSLKTIVNSSHKAAFNEQTDLIFIDSDHSYEHVKSELNKYSSLIPQKGYIAIHDYTFIPSVKDACDECLLSDQWNKIVIIDFARKGHVKGCGTLLCQKKY